MAEQEITYIPYGLDEISLLDLMTSLANGIDSYLNSRNWGKKAKYRDAWLRAYQDIMTLGITGASNNTGIWRINHNGPNIDLSNKSNIEREMYGDAAYYILLQMSQMTPRTKKEKKDESSKIKFDNTTFNSGLTAHIGSSLYGGMSSDKWNERWANLDPEDRGIRGTAGRQKEMSNQLLNYLNKIELEKDKYSFEDTPYGSFDEWKNRATRAIAALNKPEWNDDDKNALNALGIDYNEWFNTGADKMVTVNMGDGTQKQMTQAEYNDLEDKQKADELAALLKTTLLKMLLQRSVLLANRFNTAKISPFRLLGLTSQQLALKYKSEPELLTALLDYSKKEGLSSNEYQELKGAFQLYNSKGRLKNLSKEELEAFKGLRNYNNISPNRLKKLEGLDGVYYDTTTQQVIRPYRTNWEGHFSSNLSDLLALMLPEAIAQRPRGGGYELTSADKRDISATLLDLASMVNPEMISGTITALTASGLRSYNSVQERGLWDTLTDWKTWADWGTGALGGTALLGDASSIAKFARGFGKLMTIPAIGMAIANVPEAKAAWDKIDSNNLVQSIKKLTPQDYHALSSVLIGILSGKNYIKGNLAERKVLQESGINTLAATKRREYLNKYGLTKTKTSNLETVPTLKVKINGSNKEITLKPEQQKRILESARKAGNSEEARNKAVKEELQGKEHTTTTGEKIKVDENTKVVVVQPGKFLDRSWIPARLGNTKQLFGTYQLSAIRDESKNFENWLSGRSKWERWKPWSLGTNSNLRRIHNNIFGKDFDKSGLVSSASGEESPYARKPLEQGEVKSSNHIEGLPDKSGTRETSYRRAIMKRYLDIMSGKFSKKDLLETTGTEGFKIGNEEVRVSNIKDAKGNPLITVYTSVGRKETFKSLELAKKFIADIVKQQKNNITSGRITKENIQKIGRVLLDLKRKGWLKQGGTINNNDLDTIINDFFKK